MPFSAPKAKRPEYLRTRGDLGCKSLTMTYFHTGTRTIIGAKSFHCPVRDGKEWYQLAMVIRHKGLLPRDPCGYLGGEFIELNQLWLFDCVTWHNNLTARSLLIKVIGSSRTSN